MARTVTVFLRTALTRALSWAQADTNFQNLKTAVELVSQDVDALAEIVDTGGGGTGANGETVLVLDVFLQSASVPSAPSGGSYTFSTDAFTPPAGGWSRTMPASTTTPTYRSTFRFATATPAAAVAGGTWSTPVVVARNGANGSNGTNGINSGLAYIYQRAASVPALPSATVTYTFATGGLTGLTNGWSATPPSGSNPLYVSIAPASGTGATDTIGAGEWSTPVVLAQNGANGTNGTNGLNTAVVYIYQRGTSAPALPSAAATFTFSTGGISGLTNGWSATIPAGSNPLYVAAATASSATSTDTIAAGEWTSPVVLTQNGSNGAAGGNSASVYIYRRSATAPALPSATATYTFATAALSGLTNGWTTTVPAGTDPLWVSTATAFSTGATDTITSGEWAAAQILVQNGTNGTNGANGTRTAVLEMYQWASSAPTLFPSGTSTYTWAAGTFTAPATANGWTLTPGTPAAGQRLYVVRQLFSDSLTTATSAVTWAATSSAPTGAAGTDGSNGANGQRVGILEVYQWAASAPTTFPSGTSTYTWTTGAFTAPSTPNGWSLLPGAPVPGQTLWGISVVVSNAQTSATSTATWNSTTPYPVGAAGSNGAAGLNNALVYIYQRATSAPAVPSTTATYTFASAAITGLNNGWSATIPAGTNPLYVAVATASSSGASDTIASGEWAAPVVLAQNGAGGAAGGNAASVFVYQRAASTPTLPSAAVTYTFATGAITGLNNGWTATIPTGVNPLWVTTATAFSAGASDTIAAGEWAAAAKLAENGVDGTNGTNGTNGLSSAVVYIYQRAASAPTVPSSTATYTFATKSLTGINNGWSTTIPAGSNPLYVTAATASSSGATDTIATGEWSAPVVLAQNGAGGVAGATGIGLYIYQRAAAAPALPSTTATYTFATASLTGLNNGWVTSVPSGTNPLWVSTATALSTGATDSIAPAEWATVSKLAENGTNGSNGADGSSVYTATIYRLAETLPATPTGGTFNFATATLTAPSGWSVSALSPALLQRLYVCTFTFTGSPTSTVTGGTWSTPVVLTQNGAPGPADAGGSTIASQFATGISAVAEVRLNADGNIEERVNGGAWTNRGRWFLGTVAGSFTVIAELSGAALSSGTTGISQSLSTTRAWALTQAPAPAAFKTSYLTLRIYTSTSDLAATVSWRLQAEYEA